MGESTDKSFTYTSASGPTDKGVRLVYLGAGAPGSVPVEPAATRKRAPRTWQPSEYERAVLSLPDSKKMSNEQFCQELDRVLQERGLPAFPVEWQRSGQPRTYQQAWDSKNPRLRNLIDCRRRDIWRRLRSNP
jgi:hypothetical protein